MGDMLSKTSHKKKDPAIDQEFLKNTSWLIWFFIIGLVLCRDKNYAVVEITLPEDNTQIFASNYETILPSKEALQKLLEEQMLDEE